MRTVIIAPHPDDEWVGCGCTILKQLDERKKLTVLLITRAPCSERRIPISKRLAQEYDFPLKFLDEPEMNINKEKFLSLLDKEVKEGDNVFIPDFDTHPDHQFINRLCKEHLETDLIEYAVYNNSAFFPRRIIHKTLHLIHGNSFPSFRLGTHEYKTFYKLPIKQKNIKMFGEVPRHADIFRKVIC